MKALLIIAQKNFRDEELFETREELEKVGISVDVASITTEMAYGMLGKTYMPDLAVKDAKVDAYDAIVVVGGAGSPQLANYPEVIKLLQVAQQKGKLLAAICLGPMVLAKAGVLKKKRATVWTSPAFPQSVRALEAGGCKYSTEKLVQDDNLITAFGPDQARQFGRAIAEKLKEIKGN
ncbi:MAG: DJ-1/PfpI family protein [Candidatus Nanoarchaeia archaeon]